MAPTGFVIDNQIVLNSRNMYTCPPGLCAIKCNGNQEYFYAIAATTFSLKRPRFLPCTKGQRCFCIFYEKFAINFFPYSLVLIIFGLVFDKSNMISNIHLVVTKVPGPLRPRLALCVRLKSRLFQC